MIVAYCFQTIENYFLYGSRNHLANDFSNYKMKAIVVLAYFQLANSINDLSQSFVFSFKMMNCVLVHSEKFHLYYFALSFTLSV